MKPKVCILRTDGTNCDEELFYAFEKFGGAPEYVHINHLKAKSERLKAYQILALPGGFSYGDDIASGKVLAIELISFLKDELKEFIVKKGLILGICNGFQTLIRTGLLPFNHIGKMDATLITNDSGHFECRWVKVKIENSKCVFLNQLTSDPVSEIDDNGSLEIAVNHGEGKFYAQKATISKIENHNLVTFRYVDDNGKPTQDYPANPNGSLNAIAGICDSTGRILGLMPHPEKFVEITQHPNWRRFPKGVKPHGAQIFENMIRFAKQS
ncbi:phosphoribosylformylglycinamidine synthase I [Candidatus Curtissbacteria bacterium RIFCSPLOWO2_01_FULL_38_11b]|uniref:Phosphoribosylformylglycinamidine synthase subunit PurQ n=1 Tax=Candidatus Curtissbacteria bacterium RIFCSPLOWO2_01_FULL_38_11b TaxID=1797725 RepID=A0A1F5H0C9_9BACT|nr:MAG: phosphoribosylformylglycinamidine synthase I [Candidatus Curtissbacteria bacterium RIFCSPLOWO2_01_FULL_38_11b]